MRQFSYICATLLLLNLTACDGGPGPTTPSTADSRDHAHDDHGHDHAGEIKLTAEAVAQHGIKIEPAALWNLRPTFMAPARVGFNTEAMAHVGSPLVGRVSELKVRVGDKVAKGDPLVIVESPELGEAQADYFEKRVTAETAGPAAELAKVSWERAKEVYEQAQGMSLTDVQRREAEYKAAAATLRSAQANAIGAANRLRLLGMSQERIEAVGASGHVDSRFVISAPLDGEVVEREITMGELVGPDRESLLVLADTVTLWVLADVPEARLSEVVIGAPVWIRSGNVDPHRHEGQVSHIASVVDSQTRSGAVRVVVKCEDQTLKPGMFVQVEITSTDRANPDPQPVVAVPEAAIQTIEGRSVIFVPVANEENTFTHRDISIGKPVGGLVPVYTGLAEGEQLVTAGSFILKAELGKGTAEHQH